MAARPPVFVFALAACLLVASGCGGEGGGARRDQNEIVVALAEPQNPLIPQNTTESEGHQVIEALFVGLVDYDERTNQPFNVMAESIETVDQQHYTIRIKPGWTFHDGTPVTAQSYVNAWNQGAYGPNAWRTSGFFRNIEGYQDLQCGRNAKGAADCAASPPASSSMSGLQIVDDTTFTVALSEPFSIFPLTLGYTAFFPVPDALMADPEAFGERPIGNGPFRMDRAWGHDQSIHVVRYDGYAGARKPKVARIEFRIYDNFNTAYNDLLAGTLDYVRNLPPESRASAREELGERFISVPRADIQYLGFPLYQPGFADPKVRLAFSKAIDREAITKAVYGGAAVPARSLVSPQVLGGRTDPCGYACAYDPVEAKRLFDEAGGLDDEPLTLWINAGQGNELWVEAVANQLAQNLGIAPPVFQLYGFSEYLDFLEDEAATGPFRMGWIMDYPSAQNFLEPLYSTGSPANFPAYSNPAVDALIQQGNRAPTDEQAIASYQRAEDLVLRDLPTIPVFYAQTTAGSSERLRHAGVNVFGEYNLLDVEIAG